MGAYVLRNTVAAEQRQRGFQHPRCEILGQLSTAYGANDYAGRGDQLLDLAARVRAVPRRALGAEPRQRSLDHGYAVKLARSDRGKPTRPDRGDETQVSSSSDHRCRNCSPETGTTLSGRASLHARRSHD